MSRDFWPFFLLKRLDLGWIKAGKNDFCKEIHEKSVSGYCVVNDYADNGVSVVNNYADMCQRSQPQRGHCVCLVNGYADTQEIILLWKK